jgi:hypothetical protein
VLPDGAGVGEGLCVGELLDGEADGDGDDVGWPVDELEPGCCPDLREPCARPCRVAPRPSCTAGWLAAGFGHGVADDTRASWPVLHRVALARLVASPGRGPEPWVR